MASIRKDKRSGNYTVFFWHGGKQFNKSCETKSQRGAEIIKRTVEEFISRDLKTGRVEVPEGADVAEFIYSNGTRTTRATRKASDGVRLAAICYGYLGDQVDKAASTVAQERTHVGHFKRVMGEQTRPDSITLATLQNYANTRLAEPNRYGGFVGSATVRKELVTFSLVWTWARQRGHVSGECPLRDPHSRKWAVKLPKPKESRRFVTTEEAGECVSDGDYVYLDGDEVKDLLKHIKDNARHPWIYPMVALVAYTGIRRSEMQRCLVQDVKFEQGEVVVREKKRVKTQQESTRRVPLKDGLAEVLQDWLKVHPGGTHLITQDGEPLGEDAAHYHFKKTIGEAWHRVKGFHTLRHSFAAICVRAGIPSNVIGEMMGHSTQEMMDLYQHLYPQDVKRWMADEFPL